MANSKTLSTVGDLGKHRRQETGKCVFDQTGERLCVQQGQRHTVKGGALLRCQGAKVPDEHRLIVARTEPSTRSLP